MSKYKILFTGNERFVIVGEGVEIRIDDMYLDDTGAIRRALTDDRDYWRIRPNYRRIVASIAPLERVSHITTSYAEVCEMIEDAKIESESEKSFNENPCYIHDPEVFIEGFKCCHKKRSSEGTFTEVQLRLAMAFGRSQQLRLGYIDPDKANDFLKELKQPTNCYCSITLSDNKCEITEIII